MFIPLWVLVLASGGLFIGGFLIAAIMSAGKAGDDESEADEYLALARQQSQLRAETDAAHTRCSDALETARNRIERALAVETPKAAHGVKKMARLLRGDEA